MVKFKKLLALALVAIMVVGGSITAFADEPTSGGQTGAGANEGHVEKTVKKFVLPTTTTTTFAYTMDPERLIQATEGAKYAAGTTFPNSTGDTGVYFQTDTNVYANASNTVQAVNKSSVPQILTVTMKATGADTDINLIGKDAVATSTTAGLYLGGTVGTVEQAIPKTDAGVTWIIKVPGNDTNYHVVVKEGTGGAKTYDYEIKTTGLTAWKAVDIAVSGAVTDGIAVTATTTAPSVAVTWAFTDVPTDESGVAYTANAKTVDKSDITYTTMAACSVNEGKAFIRLVSGQNADASKITSVTVDGTAATYEVTQTGAVVVNGVSDSAAHEIIIVHDGTYYSATTTAASGG
ncbi:hypothetical protein [Butyrivibrio proteoclasticus]|uniref:hypothetical protein n=1 Tax=Butyrivibrio proteoclasticus TaxID=43305 RepID=UPI00047A0E4E|nr:hypothetical protein [Butyrivibrio proteoclasticus]